MEKVKYTKEFKNWVPLQRDLAADKRNGKISKGEYDLYVWMKTITNLEGIAIVSLDSLCEDVFSNRVKRNYVNQLLLSLKAKRYIYYYPRSGKKGSFDVHFDKIFISGGILKNIDSFFDTENNGFSNVRPHQETEVSKSPGNVCKRLFDEETINKRDILEKFTEGVRGYGRYNDNDTDNKDRLYKNKITVSNYDPQIPEEKLCLVIAKRIGEKNMDFILSILKKHGIDVINQAYEIFERKISEDIKNPPAYFNAIIKDLVK